MSACGDGRKRHGAGIRDRVTSLAELRAAVGSTNLFERGAAQCVGRGPRSPKPPADAREQVRLPPATEEGPSKGPAVPVGGADPWAEIGDIPTSLRREPKG